MGRFLLTGDLHLSDNPRDSYRFNLLQVIKTTCRKTKPDALIIAGDLTEEKDRHPARLVNRIVDELKELAEIVPVVIDQGNHDYKEEEHPFFAFVRHLRRVQWISKPTEYAKGMLILPHSHDPARDWENIDLANYPMIICHQTFNGAQVGFGRGLEGVDPDILPKKSTTFCGDIHVPQEFGKKLVYIGAPYHVDFGDDYKARMIWVQDNPRNWVSVDTSQYPQKRAIHMHENNDDPEQIFFNDGDLLKITCDVDTLEGWDSIAKALRKRLETKGARIWSISPKMIRKAVRRRHRVADQASDLDTLDAFGRRHDLSPEILKTGRNLLRS